MFILRLIIVWSEFLLLFLGMIVLYLAATFPDNVVRSGAPEIDWWLHGLEKFVSLAGVSFVVAAVSWLLNRKLFPLIGITDRSLPIKLALIALVLLCVASIWGTVDYALTKPIFA